MLEIGLFCFIAVMSSFGALIRIVVKIFRASNPPGSLNGDNPGANPRALPANCPACAATLSTDIALCKFCGHCGARCVA
jgi:hypothetical protein